MSGYYEWQVDGDARLPHFTYNTDQSLMAVGGIWQMWGTGSRDGLLVPSLRFRQQRIGHLHPRMPLILSKSDWAKWLGEEGHGAATLMKTTADGEQSHPVSDAISSNRATGLI